MVPGDFLDGDRTVKLDRSFIDVFVEKSLGLTFDKGPAANWYLDCSNVHHFAFPGFVANWTSLFISAAE